MTRQSFDIETGKWLDPEEYQVLKVERLLKKYGNKSSDLPSPYVAGDTKEYRSPLSGKMVTSRSQRRDEMKRYDVIEIGNEKLDLKKRTPKRSDVAPVVKRVYERLESNAPRRRKRRA